MKVLIVDDTPENVYMLETLLKAHGWEVSAAKNGEDAMERLRRARPDLIISDILMPKMDGFQLCRAVKTDIALKDIPFIFYTATYTTENDRDFALNLGASRFIIKPTDPEEFIEIIKGALAESEKGLIQPGGPFMEKETEYLKEHQARLIKKLEDKLVQLQEANQALKREIAERKKAHELLHRSEAMLAEAQRAAHIGNWEWKPRTGELYWSDENYRIFGLSKDIKPSVKAFLDTVHPDDLDHVRKSIDDALQGKPYDIDMRIIRPDGAERSINARAAVEFDEAGKPVRMFGVVLDITERKRSEEELQQSAFYFDMTPDPFLVLTPDAKIKKINPAFSTIFGYTTKEALGKSVLGFVPEGEYAKIKQEIDSAIITGEMRHFETIALTKNGDMISVSPIGKALKDADGTVISLIASVRDITERKHMEKALKEAATRYRIVANNTSDWEFWLDPEGKFNYTSPSSERITGHTVGEFIADQHLLGNIIHPQDRPYFDEHFHKATTEKRPGALQFRVVRPDGTYRWIDHVCQPVFDPEGTFLGTRGSNRDITERKQIEEERERLVQELKDALARVNQLSGMLPICSYCKKIRDDKGYWAQVETYITEHSEAEFSHGMCPDCEKNAYEELEKLRKDHEGK